MKLVIFLALTVANVLAFDLRGFRPRGDTASELNFDKRNVGAHQFPYQVCIDFEQSFSEHSLCSGSLIDNEWILTAAHCAMNAIKATVYLGNPTGPKAEVMHTVAKDDIVVHSDWDISTGNNDISLIRIPYTVYSATIQPVKLPSASTFHSNYYGDNTIATGWHHESDIFSTARSKLILTALQVSPNKVCSSLHGAPMPRNSMCALTQESVSACGSDSGGPLVLEISKIQIGLKTLGRKAEDDCPETYSAVFIRISNYLDWIKSYTNISY